MIDRTELIELAQAVATGLGSLSFALVFGWDRSIGIGGALRWLLSAVVLAPVAWFALLELTNSHTWAFCAAAFSAMFGYFFLMGFFTIAKWFARTSTKDIFKTIFNRPKK